LNIRFAADNNSFAGTGRFTFAPLDPPFEYKGVRIGDGGDGKGEGADGFREGGYFALRIDAMARQIGLAPGVKPVEVMLTARNYQGGRRGLWYTESSFFLLGSDGVEYKPDGNSYGRSGAERMTATVWLEKDEQGAATYVFPKVPAAVTPSKLIVREKGKTILEFDLAGLPTARGAKVSGPVSGVAAGEPITLGQLEARLISLNRGLDRNWETVVSYKNSGKAPVKLDVAGLSVALYDAEGETRRNTGDFYAPEAGLRRRLTSSVILPPGGETKIRYWIVQSTTFKPTRYRLQDAQGGKDGPIPSAMLPSTDR